MGKEIPATPNTKIGFVLDGGRAFVVISATRTTSELGTLEAQPRHMRAMANALDMQLLTHPSKLHRRTQKVNVVISSRGIFVAAEGLRPDGGSGNKKKSRPRGKSLLGDYWWGDERNVWLETAAIQKEAVVLLLAGDPTVFSSATELVEWMSTSRSGFSARARVIDMRAADPRLDRYEFLAADGTTHSAPPFDSTVISDADVLVDLRNAASGRLAHKPDLVAGIADLATTLRSCDFMPGFAISQLSWNRSTATTDPKQRAHCRAAATAWTHTPIHKLSDQRVVTKRWTDTFNSLIAQDDQHDTDDSIRNDIFVLMGYVNMLKAATFWHDFRGKKFEAQAQERVDAFLELVNFINRDGLGSSAYPFALCTALLLGDSRTTNAESFFKTKNGIDGIYGTAWDLHFLAFLDIATAGELPDTGVRPVFLLTADKGLKQFRKSVVLRQSTRTNINSSIATIQSELKLSERLNSKQTEQISNAMQRLYVDGHMRKMRDALPAQDSLLQFMGPLEEEVSKLFPTR